MDRIPSELKFQILSASVTNVADGSDFSSCLALSSTNRAFRNVYKTELCKLVKLHLDSLLTPRYFRFLRVLNFLTQDVLDAAFQFHIDNPKGENKGLSDELLTLITAPEPASEKELLALLAAYLTINRFVDSVSKEEGGFGRKREVHYMINLLNEWKFDGRFLETQIGKAVHKELFKDDIYHDTKYARSKSPLLLEPISRVMVSYRGDDEHCLNVDESWFSDCLELLPIINLKERVKNPPLMIIALNQPSGSPSGGSKIKSLSAISF